MTCQINLFIVCVFEIALLLFVVVSSVQAESFEANSGDTLDDGNNNRLYNFIKNKAIREPYDKEMVRPMP